MDMTGGLDGLSSIVNFRYYIVAFSIKSILRPDVPYLKFGGVKNLVSDRGQILGSPQSHV